MKASDAIKQIASERILPQIDAILRQRTEEANGRTFTTEEWAAFLGAEGNQAAAIANLSALIYAVMAWLDETTVPQAFEVGVAAHSELVYNPFQQFATHAAGEGARLRDRAIREWAAQSRVTPEQWLESFDTVIRLVPNEGSPSGVTIRVEAVAREVNARG